VHFVRGINEGRGIASPPTSFRSINYRSGSPDERIQTRSRLARAVLSAKGRRDLATISREMRLMSRARYLARVRIRKRDVLPHSETFARLDFERRYVQILGDSD
jgi:hypothetical protein